MGSSCVLMSSVHTLFFPFAAELSHRCFHVRNCCLLSPSCAPDCTCLQRDARTAFAAAVKDHLGAFSSPRLMLCLTLFCLDFKWRWPADSPLGSLFFSTLQSELSFSMTSSMYWLQLQIMNKWIPSFIYTSDFHLIPGSTYLEFPLEYLKSSSEI